MLYKLSKSLFLPTSLMNVFLAKGKAVLLFVFFCVSCRLYGILPPAFPQPNKKPEQLFVWSQGGEKIKKSSFPRELHNPVWLGYLDSNQE